MKALLSLMLIIISATCTATLFAQDFVNTDPTFNKVLVDTTLLVAIETTFEPGKQTSLHTHSAFFVYVLKGGTLKVEYADGKTESLEFKAGDYVFNGPERPHRSTNIGNEPIKMIIVELKEHPYIESGKVKAKQRN